MEFSKSEIEDILKKYKQLENRVYEIFGMFKMVNEGGRLKNDYIESISFDYGDEIKILSMDAACNADDSYLKKEWLSMSDEELKPIMEQIAADWKKSQEDLLAKQKAKAEAEARAQYESLKQRFGDQ